MKRGFLIMLSMIPAYALFAQHADTLRSQTGGGPEPSPFVTAIGTVLHDLPANLQHITGELVLAEGETENYASRVMLPGAQHCIITRYHAVADTSASWQAQMYKGDDFEKASRAYHVLYNQLKACYLFLPDSSIVFLKGEWGAPREEIPFATSTLHLNTGEGFYEEAEVDLEMIYQATDWVININIFRAPPSLSAD